MDSMSFKQTGGSLQVNYLAIFVWFMICGISSIFSYYIINICDYVITVLIAKREMCIKILNFNYDDAKGLPFSGGASIFWEYENNPNYVYEYFNDVCYFRLWGLIFITWCTIFYVYSWGMWYAEAAEIHQSTTH